ncbi:formylglycine-generating enzyme family protein [uncultured Polaribacter sp.]|uniref:formylglycine-generating enzyme family protein n=1 Tax=uncultured Polaribacter sp. TaxID=174711 RepID=UPI0026330E4B|nr:formylglycine-generating enzyme family protein [uncultured Polaribacter sp.]
MKSIFLKSLFAFVVVFLFACTNKTNKKEEKASNAKEIVESPVGMVWVPTKTFLMGAKPGDTYAMPREKPAHKVTVSGFFMDATEVTNGQFKKFVEETKYITVAERPLDWDEIKKDLPPGTPKPDDSILQPGSLIFNKQARGVVSMENYGQWWTWKVGANWRQPEGLGSSIEGKENYPVVHVGLEDALAYCKWANRRLPTEAEWESAAQGSNTDNKYVWGNNLAELNKNANTWQGTFPTENISEDNFEYISPIKSYPENNIGIYDMAGNVWEITTDFFDPTYYKTLDVNKTYTNPKGAKQSRSPTNPYQTEYVMKGGSFLCHASYCASFRISARMGMEPSSSSDHIGFRTVATKEMLAN